MRRRDRQEDCNDIFETTMLMILNHGLQGKVVGCNDKGVHVKSDDEERLLLLQYDDKEKLQMIARKSCG